MANCLSCPALTDQKALISCALLLFIQFFKSCLLFVLVICLWCCIWHGLCIPVLTNTDNNKAPLCHFFTFHNRSFRVMLMVQCGLKGWMVSVSCFCSTTSVIGKDHSGTCLLNSNLNARICSGKHGHSQQTGAFEWNVCKLQKQLIQLIRAVIKRQESAFTARSQRLLLRKESHEWKWKWQQSCIYCIFMTTTEKIEFLTFW